MNWYLEDVENEIESEAELLERKTIVEKVIYRLVHHVCIYSCASYELLDLNNFHETYREYLLAPTDDLITFWGQRSRSQQAVEVVMASTLMLGH